jgi:hypothetical protein
VEGCGLDSSMLRYGPVAGSCEHSNETWGSIKKRKILDYLRDHYLPKKEILFCRRGLDLSSFLGSTAQLRPWPPPQNPAKFLGGFSTILFFTG